MSQRVLAVDDEPQILRFLKPSLTAAGYDVITERWIGYRLVDMQK